MIIKIFSLPANILKIFVICRKSLKLLIYKLENNFNLFCPLVLLSCELKSASCYYRHIVEITPSFFGMQVLLLCYRLGVSIFQKSSLLHLHKMSHIIGLYWRMKVPPRMNISYLSKMFFLQKHIQDADIFWCSWSNKSGRKQTAKKTPWQKYCDTAT